jgi:hypothetical protein
MTSSNQNTEILNLWQYDNIQKSARIRQKWDILAIEVDDKEKVQWAIENYFEPFGVTTNPKKSTLADHFEITTVLWFKRPAHINEEEQ